MSENIRIIRVFIASPGGLEVERRAAHEVIHEVNQLNSEEWGCQFNLMGWEDTIPGYQRAQSLINADLDKCQYFIGVLWNKWGTKPDLDESGFTSGFEEEFCRAQDLAAAGSMKDIALYFKTVDFPDGFEPLEPIRKVRDFRQKCIDEKQIFFKDFSETTEFRDLVRYKITKIGWLESKLNAPPELGKGEAEQSPQEKGEAEQSPQENVSDKEPRNTKIFDQEALDFISAISSHSREREQTSSYEVARFRLIAASLKRSGNDEPYLGTHDANLIFRHRKEMSFSIQEIRTLADCGIVGFDHQNVPLWRWLVASGTKNEQFQRVKILAFAGNTEEKINAIKILQILGETVPELELIFTRAMVLRNWLHPETSVQIFDAATQFLSSNGEREDIEIFDRLCSDSTADRKAKIDAMVASIKARYSHEEALSFICTNNVEPIPQRLVDEIFSTPSILPTNVLSLCLSVKSDGIRLRAVNLLAERRELAVADAHSLLNDSNHRIRLMAVEYLQNSDNPLSPDIIRSVLTFKRGSGVFNFFNSAETDETYYDRYLGNQLKGLDSIQLKERVGKAGVFNDKELLALYGKFSKKLSDEIRANLRDRFVAMFEESVKTAEALPGMQADYRARVYRLRDFYQKKLCSGVLAILCRLKVKSDIGLVRATLDAIKVEPSTELLEFLAKFGDWSDVGRIERLGPPSNGKTSLLDFTYNTYAIEKASAIFQLGKGRIGDLLNAEISLPIRKAVIKLFPKSVFANLSNEAIIKELNRDDDEYRILFALRCVVSLSKERIETLIDLYLQRDGQRYYNSVHWLDLGASLSKKQATAIARRELVRRSQ